MDLTPALHSAPHVAPIALLVGVGLFYTVMAVNAVADALVGEVLDLRDRLRRAPNPDRRLLLARTLFQSRRLFPTYPWERPARSAAPRRAATLNAGMTSYR